MSTNTHEQPITMTRAERDFEHAVARLHERIHWVIKASDGRLYPTEYMNRGLHNADSALAYVTDILRRPLADKIDASIAQGHPELTYEALVIKWKDKVAFPQDVIDVAHARIQRVMVVEK